MICNIRNSVFLSPKLILRLMAITVFAIVAAGMSNAAFAATATATNSCTQMQSWGFTTGIVYCVQTSLDAAISGYITAMQASLRYYEGMMAAVAIILFGLKAMNSSLQEPFKELGILLMRLLIGVFVFENAINIYHWVAGTLPANNGIMNEAIGWVTGTGTAGGGGNFFNSLISANCTTSTPPVQFEGYPVWQAFDCMFSRILGAADPNVHPYAFSTSLLVIIAASLFSATAGVLATTLGLTFFIGALMFVFRALYLVLLSFVCVAFMALLAPLIGPLIFFESEFINQKFKQWAGIIISCIFQPVMVIGFLAMGISVADQFIEGNLSAPGCVLPTYPSGGVDTRPGYAWGQDGSGVCSFSQLFNQGQSGAPDLTMEQRFSSMIDQNSTVLTESVVADPQEVVNTNTLQNIISPFTAGVNNYNNGSPVTAGDPGVGGQNTPLQAGASTFKWDGATRLKQYAPIKQLTLTLITLIFVIYAMSELLEVIPEMAQRMTISVGVNLARQINLPFENELRSLGQETKDKALGAAQGKGLVPQLSKYFSAKKSTSGTVPGQSTGFGSGAGTIKRN